MKGHRGSPPLPVLPNRVHPFLEDLPDITRGDLRLMAEVFICGKLGKSVPHEAYEYAINVLDNLAEG